MLPLVVAFAGADLEKAVGGGVLEGCEMQIVEAEAIFIILPFAMIEEELVGHFEAFHPQEPICGATVA